jgi:hypothetical protein
MMWKTWKELDWMEKMDAMTSMEAIPAVAPAPETEEIPHWKSDDGEDGHVRDNVNGVGVSTPKENLGHQRPY